MKKVGRPKGSTKKKFVEQDGIIQLALNQVKQANETRSFEMALRSMSEGLSDVVNNTNKGFMDISKRIQALEARIADLEKHVTLGTAQEDSPAN